MLLPTVNTVLSFSRPHITCMLMSHCGNMAYTTKRLPALMSGSSRRSSTTSLPCTSATRATCWRKGRGGDPRGAAIGAEERNQSEAIGRNIFEMARLEVPIITTIIGEGGSGGALAISVADQVLMMQYSVYSVISPEGCASILWKTADKASDAAEALGITAHRLKALGLIDKIISEPVGGAHRDYKQAAANLKRALNDAYRQVADLKVKDLLQTRYDRLQSYGRYNDTKEH